MKRRKSLETLEGNNKRQRDSPSDPEFFGGELFDFPERQRYIASIIKEHLDGTAGYIAGTIDSISEDNNLGCIITTEISEHNSQTSKVRIVFGKNCARRLCLRKLQLRPSSDIFLSLQECELILGHLPKGIVATLKFPSRVLVKIVSRQRQSGTEEVIVNLWASKIVQSPKAVGDAERKLSKRERRILRAQQHFEEKKKAASNEQQLQHPQAESNKMAVKEQNFDHPPQVKSNAAAAGAPALDSRIITPDGAKITPKDNYVRKGPLDMQAGRQCDTMLLTPVSQVTQRNHLYNVAAVALSGSEVVRIASGDFNCTLQLVDPSNRMLSDNSHLMHYCVKANCFTKGSRSYLPVVKAGDIIVLKDAKGGGFNGSASLVGYHDRLKWAIYGRDNRFHHGVIPSDVTPDQHHNPFFESEDPQLLEYCSQLRDWWDAIELERTKAQRLAHPVGKLATPPARSARPHFLIKDATPDTVSNGYFDCIAEVRLIFENASNLMLMEQVVHKHRGDRCYDIYITDYTSNSSCPNYEADWTPRGLSQSILKVELWDKSAEFGPNMEIGGVYSFRNIRIRRTNYGFYEAKMQELKLFKLDAEDPDSPNAALKCLLERKAKWSAKNAPEERLDNIELTSIKDVEVWSRFNCVAEVLFVQYSGSSSRVNLYVTDYTENNLLPNIELEYVKMDHLQKRVYKILLRDSQAEKAKKLEPGDICLFLKVITKLINKEHVGDLGGEQQLIKRLNGGLPSHQKVMEGLLSRKRNFVIPMNNLIATDIKSEDTPEAIPDSRAPQLIFSENPSACTSIRQLNSCNGAEALFDIPARVALANPRRLQDFIGRWCKKCDTSISPKYKACIQCNDTDHEYVDFKYHFNLWIEEDGEEGLELPIVVWDDAICLQKMPRIDLTQNRRALDEFRHWFEAFAGNVLQYQDDRFEGKETELQSPLVAFRGIRYEEDGQQRFRLYSYMPVE
ncbi:hypothetical protein D9757_003385 [Collybiopsis confluens]|uniref:Telomeric single stranded DNA binding POT1/Cdc13 domain-containing protein n=1 Tax=Collybiopsis confluens TaxID=2823264 RepID=A0A8H5MCU6_9AGAR|nr:hypothetical protein D9757_003385 [Collybiopsis confluens]